MAQRAPVTRSSERRSRPARISLVLLASVALTTAGACGGSSHSHGGSSTADCSVAGENAQILATMESWYFWDKNLPANVDPSAYPSPDALLDALRYQPLDRFSFITTKSADQAFYGAGQYVGFGIGIEIPSTNDAIDVTRSFPDSPAANAGLDRGDRITAINGVSVATLIQQNQLETALAAGQPGVNVALTYLDLAQAEHQVTLTSAVITQPSVGTLSILKAGTSTVGYLPFDSFIDTSNAALDAAFAQLAAAGATELILDERYNGGGEISVAQHLASLIAGSSVTGKPFVNLTYNDQHQKQNQTFDFKTVDGALGLSRLLVITTNSTASSSELLINGLRPYLDVVTVGDTTFGKPVGENGFDVCSDVLYPMTFQITNADGAGDYFDGLPATCAAGDDLTHALGDPNESSLAEALAYVRTGSCGVTTSAEARALAKSGHSRTPASYGWRRLVGGY